MEPNSPTARIGAPRACRYFGRNLRQRFSPRDKRSMAAETATMLRSSPSESRRLSRFSLEPCIEVVEGAGGPGDARLVLAMRERDAVDQRGHAGCLRMAVALFLEVDVVHDLGDRSQRPIARARGVE